MASSTASRDDAERAAEAQRTDARERLLARVDKNYLWNWFLMRELRRQQQYRWMLPVVHGHIEQRVLSVFGRALQLTLIARRSRQFAGVRFLKRGVNEAGYVGNDVETGAPPPPPPQQNLTKTSLDAQNKWLPIFRVRWVALRSHRRLRLCSCAARSRSSGRRRTRCLSPSPTST